LESRSLRNTAAPPSRPGGRTSPAAITLRYGLPGSAAEILSCRSACPTGRYLFPLQAANDLLKRLGEQPI
jgi:hypothetical protein